MYAQLELGLKFLGAEQKNDRKKCDHWETIGRWMRPQDCSPCHMGWCEFFPSKVSVFCSSLSSCSFGSVLPEALSAMGHKHSQLYTLSVVTHVHYCWKKRRTLFQIIIIMFYSRPYKLYYCTNNRMHS